MNRSGGVLDAARDLGAGVTAMRRELHRWPELGLHTPRTCEAVLAALDGLPLDITLHCTTSGVAALLTGARPGPTVLLRGDMDALPLHEDTGEECSSRTEGVMHACGHDGHTAMLAGAARLLAGMRDQLAGRVLFMFQPGEENGAAGARHMLDEGLLDLPPHAVDGSAAPVAAAYAIHLTPNAPTGMVITRPGPLMASSDRLTITVTGRGGHASQPHGALDPIPVACEIVQALQTMVTRRIDVFDPGIVTIGRIAAGTTTNVIPEVAHVEGTMRAVSAATRRRLHDGVRRVAEGIAAAHGTTAEVTLGEGYPVTVNDAGSVDTVMSVAGELLGMSSVYRLPTPTMGAEDFSYFLLEKPGAYFVIGNGDGAHREAYSDHVHGLGPCTLHNPHYDFNDELIPLGATLWVRLAEKWLATPRG